LSPNWPGSAGSLLSPAAVPGSCRSAKERTGYSYRGASIAAGIAVHLNETLSGLDRASISIVVRAVRHANTQCPADQPGPRRYDVRHTEGRESPHGHCDPDSKRMPRSGQLNRNTNHPEHRERKNNEVRLYG
jgi:hypothetical protein